MSSIRKIPLAIFVVAVAVFLVTSNVRWALNSLLVYDLGFRRHDVARNSGLTVEQLSHASKQIRDYFNSREELLDVRIAVDGATRVLFNERETLHMRDVKELVEKTFRIQEGAFLYLFLFATMGFFMLGKDFGRRLRWLLIRGGLVTLILMAVAGAASLLNFRPLFILFHQVSFTNDLWQLDPYSSYLIRMFPEGFWLDATLLVGLASAAEAVAMVLMLGLVQWWQLWHRRVAQRKARQFT